MPARAQAARTRLDAEQARALLGAVRLLQAHDARPLGDLVLARLSQRQAAGPTVVVVGEVKRGKSTLVGALLGRPGLSPVGVEVTTAVTVSFLPEGPGRIAGQAQVLQVDGARTTVVLDDIAAWVRADGAARTDPEAPLVQGVEVTVSGGELPGVVLVDTPGLAGLTASHARLALASAAGAGVLLMVADAGSPLSAPELEVLRTCSVSAGAVVLVLTRTDLYPSWREVMAADRALLRAHLPALKDIDVLGFSGQLATESLRVPGGELRDALRTASGLDALVASVRRCLDDAPRGEVAAAVGLAQAGLGEVRARLDARRQAASGDPQLHQELTAERQRLEDLRARQQRWTHDLERDLGTLRRLVADDTASRVLALRDRWTARLDRERRGLSASVARDVMAQVCVDLQLDAAEVSAAHERRLVELVSAMFGTAADTPELSTASDELRRVAPRPREAPRRPTGLMDPQLAATAFLGAGVAAKIPVAAAAAIGFVNPVALAVGGAWLGVNIAFRAVKAGRLRLQTWLQETTGMLQSDLLAAADASLRHAKPELVVAYRAHLTAALAELDAVLREGVRAAGRDKADRDRRVEALDRHLAALAAQQTLLESVLQDLRVPARARDPLNSSTSAGTPVGVRASDPAT